MHKYECQIHNSAMSLFMSLMFHFIPFYSLGFIKKLKFNIDHLPSWHKMSHQPRYLHLNDCLQMGLSSVIWWNNLHFTFISVSQCCFGQLLINHIESLRKFTKKIWANSKKINNFLNLIEIFCQVILVPIINAPSLIDKQLEAWVAPSGSNMFYSNCRRHFGT